MELNHIALSLMFMTSFLLIRNVTCIPSKFIFPAIPPISASSPIEQFEFQSSISPSESSDSSDSDSSPLISPSASSLSDSSPLSSPSSYSPADSPPLSITSLIDDITNININVPKKVKEVCKKTDHPSECSASVAPLLIDGDYEPITVLQGETKAFEHALEVARDGISNIWSAGDEKDESIVSTCKQMYDNAREEIAKAMELSTKNDKYGVNIHVSAALSFISTCQDEIPKDMKDDSTLVATNNLLSNLASNCLALGDFALDLDHDD
ncbi:hypothetical protein RND81_07G009500 [Saponaria officinalis]|uniref:Pectinesterase inhibitor domain-containing protein n=1 Tax=Saponaria officinalis TaxID=3572 RepID=A0AAW1JMF1_SAPOF